MPTFDVIPDLSQFRPDQQVRFLIETDCLASHDDVDTWRVIIRVFQRQRLMREDTVPLDSASQGPISLGVFAVGGYHVEAILAHGAETAAMARTAFDVRYHWNHGPRYGFIADYDARSSYADIQNFFRKFHLNVVQFYDWMERHDRLVPQTEVFVDPMGRTLDSTAIRDRIHALKAIQAATIAYAAVYASLTDYAETHPDDGIYDNQGKQHSLIDIFYLMDITDGSRWRSHILSEFAKVIEYGFDGLHLDQYGYPKSAQRTDGSAFWLDEAYHSFIDACRQELGADVGLIFNNVSSYPVHQTHLANQDAMYVEVWPPMVRYRHLSELIARIRASVGSSKQIILAAYLKPFREKPTASPSAVARSTLLVTAVIFVSGGHHLLLGESGGVLTEPYYPDYVALLPETAEPLRRMYDIVTADGDLLFGTGVNDVTWSFVGGGNDTVLVEGAPIDVEPSAGHVWVRIATTPQGLVVHLVNLLWLQHEDWNAIHDEPFSQTPPLSVRIEWSHAVEDVLVQRAEDAGWERQTVEWVSHLRGKALEVNIAPFDVWAMVHVPYADTDDPSREGDAG